MKRDMDLARRILFEVELAGTYRDKLTLHLDDYSSEQISYHTLLLSEAGLIEMEASSRHTAEFKPKRLTWEGHEFLDAVREDKRWHEVKRIMGTVGGFVFEIAKPVAIELLKGQVFKLI